MPLKLTAAQNPVYVSNPPGTGDTVIEWDTGNNQIRGRVYLSENNGPETLFDGNANTGSPSGTKSLPVKFGRTYRLSLKRVPNNIILAGPLTVTVEDVNDALVDMAVDSIRLEQKINPPQLIVNVSVQAFVETVRFSFETIQPTMPVIAIENEDGEEVAKSFAFFNGLQTKHNAVFGPLRPLAQDMVHTFKIVAPGQSSVGATEAVVTGTFRTGRRDVSVSAGKLRVINDSDKGGAGEIAFSFGAGDVDTKEMLGPAFFLHGNISDSSGTRNVNHVIKVPYAPPNLWLQANMHEDDSSFTLGARGMKPTFIRGEGIRRSKDGDGEYVSCTQVADITDSGEVSFKLSTFGDPVYLDRLAFELFGRIHVDAHNGQLLRMRGARLQPAQSFTGFQKDGIFTLLAAGNKVVTRTHQLVGLGADGALYHKAIAADRPSRRDEGWTRVSRAGNAPVTAVVSEPDRLSLLTLGPEGQVLYKSTIGEPHDEEWRSLGGAMAAPVVAAVETEGVIELFGVDEDGTLFHCVFNERQGASTDWKRIGSNAKGHLVALSIARIGLALFALHQDGRVLHALRRDGRWLDGGIRWQQIGRSSGASSSDARLVVRYDEAHGLTVAIVEADLMLRVLRWPEYPDGILQDQWEARGTIQVLLAERIARAARLSEIERTAHNSPTTTSH